VNTIQRRYGLEKPIWINETNAAPNRDPEWPVDRPRFNVDLEQQAWFILQGMALGFASGAASISVYKLIDIHLPSGGESFGVVRPDYSRRPGYDAYKLATSCFGSFETASLEEDPASFHVTFNRPGSLAHIAWSRTITTTTVEIPATSDSATLISWTEAPIGVQPAGGVYTLELPGQRCYDECIVGGETILLIEDLGGWSYGDECIAVAQARWHLDAQPAESVLGSLIDPIGPGIEEEARPASAVPTASATASASPTQAVSPITSIRPTDIPGTRQNLSVESGHDSGTEELALAAVELMKPESESPEALVEASEMSDMDGGESETIGLWFLGAGVGIGLGMSIIWRRRRTHPGT
jgi:hypothetical protein